MNAPAGATGRLPRSLVFAVLVWLLLLALCFAFDATAWRQPMHFVRRFGWLLLPALVLPAIPVLLTLPFARVRRRGGAAGALLLGFVGTLLLPLVLLGAWGWSDPWEMLPWLGSWSDEGFRARHPHLELSNLPFDGVVSDAQGRSAEVEFFDLRGARFAFEDCPPQVGAEHFGGMPPAPGLPCAWRYRTKTAGRENVVYVFRVRADPPMAAPREHFAAWARSTGADLSVAGSAHGTRRGVCGGGLDYSLSATREARRWDLRIVRRGCTLSIYMPEGGATPPW